MRVDNRPVKIGQVKNQGGRALQGASETASNKQSKQATSAYVASRYVKERLRYKEIRQGGTPAGGGGMYDMREWLSPTGGSLKEEKRYHELQPASGWESQITWQTCACVMRCNARRGYGSKRNAAPKKCNPPYLILLCPEKKMPMGNRLGNRQRRLERGVCDEGMDGGKL